MSEYGDRAIKRMQERQAAEEKKTETASKLRELTPEEVEALTLFAALHGRVWKQKLRDWWMKGPVVTNEQERLVYSLRNSHGPTWLGNYKLPKGTP